MREKTKVTIVMPCYNEEKRAYHNALQVISDLEKYMDVELICVNDGSNDNTLEELEKAANQDNRIRIVSYKENQGKGNALRAGVKAVDISEKNQKIAFLDADLELAPSLLINFLEIMKATHANVVIGSKMHKDSKLNYPLHRKILSLGYFIILKVLFRLNVKDTQTGIKLFDAELIKDVMPRVLVKRWAFDIEVLAICNSRGARIVDAPIVLNFSRENGVGRIKLKDIVGMFVDTLAIFYRLYIIKYYTKGRK